MKITVIALGKIKDQWINQGIDEYKKRISKFSKIVVEEIPDLPEGKNFETSVEKEGKNILSKLKDTDYVIALDVRGNNPDSIELSKKLENWFVKGGSSITFLIGGSNGFSDKVYFRANEILSLSNLTFPHQLTRVIFLEQIYRSFKIMRNEKYHK